VPAVFVALFVVVSLTTARSGGSSTRTATGRHEISLREAAPSAAIATATAPVRRLVALDSHLGNLTGPQTLAFTLLVWILAGLSFELLVLGAGLSRRSRAPPLARA
jgi:hypothetical protein